MNGPLADAAGYSPKAMAAGPTASPLPARLLDLCRLDRDEMTAAMQGIDALVFTATIGERNAEIRRDIVAGLGYLGLKINDTKNDDGLGDQQHVNIAAKNSLPIYVIQTNETDAMIRRAKILLDKN